MDAWGRVARGVAAAWLAAFLLPCAYAARPLSSVLRPDVDIYPQFFALVQAPDRIASRFRVENLGHDGVTRVKNNCNFFRLEGERFSEVFVYMSGDNSLS